MRYDVREIILYVLQTFPHFFFKKIIFRTIRRNQFVEMHMMAVRVGNKNDAGKAETHKCLDLLIGKSHVSGVNNASAGEVNFSYLLAAVFF